MTPTVEDIRDAYADQARKEQQAAQQIAALEQFVRPRLTREALERFGNIRVAHPDKAIQLLVIIAQMLKAGKIETVNDQHLRDLVERITPEKREFRITRK